MKPAEVRYAQARHGAAGFAQAWHLVGGTSEVIAAHQLESAIDRWWSTDTVRLAGPGVEGDAHLRWPAATVADAARATASVVWATAAVAQTGTVVLDSTRNHGRTLSLLPPRCAFVIDAATIVDTPADILRDRRRWWPDGPPSQIVFVSGPSRSADIEMTLTVGVHGPGVVHAFIVA